MTQKLNFYFHKNKQVSTNKSLELVEFEVQTTPKIIFFNTFNGSGSATSPLIFAFLISRVTLHTMQPFYARTN